MMAKILTWILQQVCRHELHLGNQGIYCPKCKKGRKYQVDEHNNVTVGGL